MDDELNQLIEYHISGPEYAGEAERLRDEVARLKAQLAALHSPAPAATPDVPEWMEGNVIPAHLVERAMDKGFELGYQAGHTDGMIDAHITPTTPAAPVTGWRPEWGIVSDDDILREGDQYKHEGEWVDSDAVGSYASEYKYLTFRRRLSQPAHGDEMRAVVDAAIAWRKSFGDSRMKLTQRLDTAWYKFDQDLFDAVDALAAVRGAGAEGEK